MSFKLAVGFFLAFQVLLRQPLSLSVEAAGSRVEGHEFIMMTFQEEKKAVRKPSPFILLLLLLSLVAARVHGQETQSTQSFASFWVQFKAAVAKDDKEAVANMTRFPVLIGDRITRAAFLKKYPQIFNQKVRKCFAKEKPIHDDQSPQGGGGYSLFCGDDIFLFERVDGKYQFTERGVND